jgi:hypothetical protein
MARLTFTNPDHWRAIHRLRTLPPPSDPSQLFAWIHAQHIDTAYEAHLSAAFTKLMRQHVGTNEHWLAISGPSHLGKSSAVTRVLLDRVLADPAGWRTRTREGWLRTTYVYVEVGSRQEARGILASVARFCGLPDTGREKELHDMLAVVLPQLGVELIVVAEAQRLRRVSDVASRTVDGVRQLVHLPVPFVFVGIDLDRSALLRDPGRNNDTVYQLQRRHSHLRLTPLPRGSEAKVVGIIRAFALLTRPINGLDTACLADPAVIRDLIQSVEGRPGSLINTLKRAAVEAIADNNGLLTGELVRAEARSVQAHHGDDN